MTLALHIPTPPPAPDFARLVALPIAAARLGRQRDHVARLCREKLQPQGLAFRATPPEGGQEQWFILRDYDPRLIANDAAAAAWVEPDLAGFTLKQQQQARARRACVESLREARRTWPGMMREWLPRLIEQLRQRHGVRVSRSSLHEWEQKYNRPADLAKLIDDRGGDNRGKSTPAAWLAFADHFLHENRPSVRQVWKIIGDLARENGWTWCSYKSCVAQIDNRIAPEVQLKHREPARWRKTCRPFIAQDPESWRAGECWIGDHKQLDLICRFNDSLLRPWLTTWMDWRTRRVVGWVLSDTPNSTTILGALRHGLKDDRNFGGPRDVWIDNGKDYDAWLFHGQTKTQRRAKLRPAVDESHAFGIFSALQIEPHFSIPFNPNGKSRLERWFRTLADFCRLFDTYTGESIDAKPEQLQKILAQPHRIPSFEQVYDRISGHVAGYNACDDHGRRDLRDDNGELLSPDEALARWCDTRHVMRDEKALDLLLMQWHRPVTVGRNGVAITIRGVALHYGQYNSALTPFKAPTKERRRPVLIAYDPHDLRSVRVHDEQFRYVCTAEMNQLGGRHDGDALSIEHVAQLNKQKATYEKSLKHVAHHSLTSCLTSEEQLADVAARRPRPPAKREQQPAAMRIRQTPMDGQAAAIERDQLRTAVGAESQSARPARHAMPSPSELLSRIASRQPPASRPRAAEPFVHPLSQLRERQP
ncbi:MAG: putative transposase [Phycisphaerales bacterium]|jgi:transposase InsO family protein|nr:putative transposase [Phycisphaerales bacterium]